ncbi:unnamed protein product, partial [Hapterophycus canaliculatus]
MKAVHGEVYAFHPDSYLLPTEYTKFIDVFTRGAEDAGDGGALWIVKPSDSSRGRGVYLLRELGELAYDRFSIVQR